MTTICCVLWGKEKYQWQHVEKLYAMVKDKYAERFDFVCLIDKPERIKNPNIHYYELPKGLNGWWNKLLLFSNDFQKNFIPPFLFLDLDLILTDKIDDIINLPCKRNMLYAIGEWRAPLINSSVMLFDGCQHIWDSFKPELMNKLHGDQDWIAIAKPDFMHFPKGWIQAYKYHCKNGLPKACKIVTFQGKPKIEEVTDDWIRPYYHNL